LVRSLAIGLNGAFNIIIGYIAPLGLQLIIQIYTFDASYVYVYRLEFTDISVERLFISRGHNYTVPKN